MPVTHHDAGTGAERFLTNAARRTTRPRRHRPVALNMDDTSSPVDEEAPGSADIYRRKRRNHQNDPTAKGTGTDIMRWPPPHAPAAPGRRRAPGKPSPPRRTPAPCAPRPSAGVRASPGIPAWRGARGLWAQLGSLHRRAAVAVGAADDLHQLDDPLRPFRQRVGLQQGLLGGGVEWGDLGDAVDQRRVVQP